VKLEKRSTEGEEMRDAAMGERVRSCHELLPGAEIEARVRGEKHFEGQVDTAHPKMGLFWAVDKVGVRKLIELDAYEVYRIPAASDSSSDCS
jgi:hypothetical protein